MISYKAKKYLCIILNIIICNLYILFVLFNIYLKKYIMKYYFNKIILFLGVCAVTLILYYFIIILTNIIKLSTQFLYPLRLSSIYLLHLIFFLLIILMFPVLNNIDFIFDACFSYLIFIYSTLIENDGDFC
jgi:hypothetical protein